ncbi:carbohydrate kinase family protein [Dyella acidiphila]|uniref:Carbohydrate kinase n=1 Tax=Dyella acidiphila TaxID=2775866 RepID=A0ABR9GBK1_9GAMM|nr:carbohydrate kinase [Dyella acidiphila]MBE1161443.1 carbohydrate kinase [Dyella acidiphila]
MTRSILCFGEALIDMHGEGSDGHGFARHFVPFAGGAPANVAVALAKLGCHARFAGMLGMDRFGDFLLNSLQQTGVDTVDVVRSGEANTALAFVTLDGRGERSFAFYRPPSADLLFRAEHFRSEAFDDLAIFHICSNSLTDAGLAAATVEGMRRARAAGALTSFDLNLRPALWPRGSEPREQVWPALLLADVVKVSAEEFDWLAVDGEQALLDRLWAGHTRLVVITDGPHPLRWHHPDADGELPCYNVPMVDSTGAGDAFVGGLLYQLAQQHVTRESIDGFIATLPRLHAALRYASACGAVAVTRHGSFTAMPNPAEVEQFMETHA